MVGLILHYLGSENIISLLYSLAHICGLARNGNQASKRSINLVPINPDSESGSCTGLEDIDIGNLFCIILSLVYELL